MAAISKFDFVLVAKVEKMKAIWFTSQLFHSHANVCMDTFILSNSWNWSYQTHTFYTFIVLIRWLHLLSNETATAIIPRKRVFDWSMFFVGPIRDLFPQFKKRKQIFVLHTLKFRQISKWLEEIKVTFFRKVWCIFLIAQKMCRKLSWKRDFEILFCLESADSYCTAVSKGGTRIEHGTFFGQWI